VSGDNSTAITLSGPVADVNAALAGLAYVPTLNFNADCTLTIEVSDGGATGSGGAKGASRVVTIDVLPANDDPVATDDSYTATEDTVLNIPAPGLLANDVDVDGDMLWVSIVSNSPDGYAAHLGGGAFMFTPHNDFTGTTHFTYELEDPEFGWAQATVTITVNPVNDPPYLSVGNTAYMDEDTILTFDGVNAMFIGDVDSGSGTMEWILGVPAGHKLQIGPSAGIAISGYNTNGLIVTGTRAALQAASSTLRYIPPANFSGNVLLNMGISDNGNSGAGGVQLGSGSITIVVQEVNDAPIADDDAYDADEETLLSVDAPGVLDGDTDNDGGTLAVSLVSDVTHGTLTLNGDGSFTYLGAADYTGTDTFTYQVNDGNGGND
jgi:hypothetical protein